MRCVASAGRRGEAISRYAQLCRRGAGSRAAVWPKLAERPQHLQNRKSRIVERPHSRVAWALILISGQMTLRPSTTRLMTILDN
jgi:hypothetical protein